MNKITTLVIGANQEFAGSVKEYFQSLPEIEFLGVTSEIEPGLNAIKTKVPDLVLVDSAYLDTDTIKLTVRIREISRTTKICLLTLFEDEYYDRYAAEQGVDGVIPRNLFEERFEKTLRQLFSDADQTS